MDQHVPPSEGPFALLRPHWRLVLACFLGWFLDAFDQVALLLVLPEIGKHFGVSLTAMGLVITAQSFGRILGNVGWGWLADRYGRKLTFMIGVIWFAAFLRPVGSRLELWRPVRHPALLRHGLWRGMDRVGLAADGNGAGKGQLGRFLADDGRLRVRLLRRGRRPGDPAAGLRLALVVPGRRRARPCWRSSSGSASRRARCGCACGTSARRRRAAGRPTPRLNPSPTRHLPPGCGGVAGLPVHGRAAVSRRRRCTTSIPTLLKTEHGLRARRHLRRRSRLLHRVDRRQTAVRMG